LASVVEEQIETAMPGNDLVEQTAHGMGVGHIGDDWQRVRTKLAGQRSGLVQCRFATPGEGNGVLMAKARARQRGRCPNRRR
jgi:hypothetical protein